MYLLFLCYFLKFWILLFSKSFCSAEWLIEHKKRRPGLKILQQRFDEFIIAHEEEQEQARKEREALATKGGWTVVVHHKGRKKTTEAETGVTVGSVAQAAVMDKMAKKKAQEPASNFYRFQRKEAQRNEVMMLQSKFEQDRKRIQQLRAARKFRPY
ncbi:Ribosomal RNA-processing protein 7 C-terminal domain-containing protein [Dioscorea alata]|uniref:Ribosomal RNA-processing protein 7 C-terminal domain-containing protein n=1 Tax=Dioscorea alata TaxID=55571 RepID=A0ACB7VEU2_DIOAL|nr:Ribosomal RNA-processing protein 7 C-terminal domain-containing protein [Dioscorea alata]